MLHPYQKLCDALDKLHQIAEKAGDKESVKLLRKAGAVTEELERYYDFPHHEDCPIGGKCTAYCPANDYCPANEWNE